MVYWYGRSYSKEDFISAWENSQTINEVLRTLNLRKSGSSSKLVQDTATELGLSKDHFTAKPRNPSMPDSDVFVAGSNYPTHKLKARLLRMGWEEVCLGCKRTEWFNFITQKTEPIPLCVDHIDGDNQNHRINNLRLLCNNCHAITPTFSGKARTRKRLTKEK